jgi:hypothetical protein
VEFLDLVTGAAIGASAGWAIPILLKKVVGTRYRSEKDCAACETRHAVRAIRIMVQELAIKAGVPIHDALRVGREIEKNQGN